MTAPDTDTTEAEEPQWWRVIHDENGWRKRVQSEQPYTSVSAYLTGEEWAHYADIRCPPTATEHDIYQAAVDAWAEAGFVHAPKESPGPKRMEEVWWSIASKNARLTRSALAGYFPTEEEARAYRSQSVGDVNRYRIVKVEAVVSEVDDE